MDGQWHLSNNPFQPFNNDHSYPQSSQTRTPNQDPPIGFDNLDPIFQSQDQFHQTFLEPEFFSNLPQINGGLELEGYLYQPNERGLHDLSNIIQPENQQPWAPSASGWDKPGLLSIPSTMLTMTGRNSRSEPLPMDDYMDRCYEHQTMHTLPSETGDSTFLSQPPFLSISTFETASTDDDVLSALPSDLPAFPIDHPFLQRDGPSRLAGPSSHRTSRRPRSHSETGSCTKCGRPARNRSDAKKHFLQHSKPFKCTITTCKRHKEGFSTTNDLERHTTSVHGLPAKAGHTIGYVCSECNPADKAQDDGDLPRPKYWSRLDNFRAHIKRKHANVDMEAIVKASKRDTRPADAQTVITSLHDSGVDASQHGTPDTNPFGPKDSHLSPISPHYMSRDPTNQETCLLETGGAFDQPISGFGSATDLAVPPFPLFNSSSSCPIAPDASQFYGFNHHWEKERRLSQRAESKSGIVAPLSAPEIRIPLKSPSDLHGMLLPDRSWKCKRCSKTVSRECDFKKHIKRHTRPYGCTFSGCTRRFGSRNDWKRHESTQHSIQESWLCACGGVSCKRVYSDRESFREHLLNTNCAQESRIDHIMTESQLGKDAFHRYWCGFCKKVVHQKAIEPRPWESRCEHVGNHFDKQGSTIDQWLSIETNPLKSNINCCVPGTDGWIKADRLCNDDVGSSLDSNIDDAFDLDKPADGAHPTTALNPYSNPDFLLCEKTDSTINAAYHY